MRINLPVLPSNDPYFEFNVGFDYGLIVFGHTAIVDLSTDRQDIPHVHNIHVESNFTPPDYSSIELGHDDITIIKGAGSGVNPNNTNLTFSDTEITQSTDLIFKQADDIVIKSMTWDYGSIFHDSDITIDLSTVAYKGTFTLSIDGAPYGISVFDSGDNERRLELGDIENPNRSFSITSGSHANVDLSVSKNTNLNINLCSGNGNPDLHTNPHNFIGVGNYHSIACEQMLGDMYHGSYVETNLGFPIEFVNIDGYSGAEFDSIIATFSHLDVSNSHGAVVAVNSFVTFPAIEVDLKFEHGLNTSVSLATVALLTDVDASAGQVLDSGLSTYPPARLVGDAIHGGYADSGLAVYPTLTPLSINTGHNFTTDLITLPSAKFECDIETGLGASFELYTFATFDQTVNNGHEVVVDLETVPSAGVGDVTAYTGLSSNVSLALALALKSVNASHGLNSTIDLSTTTTLSTDSWGGEYGEVELTRVLAKELISVAEHGSDGEIWLTTSQAIFPRGSHGAESEFELTLSPAIETSFTFHHGTVGAVDGLTEDDFNTFGYHGARAENITLQVAVNFPLDEMQHGASATLDDIKRGVALQLDMYHGSDVLISNFQVPLGEPIYVEIYAGEELTPSVKTTVSASFVPHPIVASMSMYDGWGGLGGFNHCRIPSHKLSPFGDNVTRLGFDPLGIDDQLIIRFDDVGDAPWNPCGGVGWDFEADMLIQPRFQFNAYAGESVEMYIPMKITPIAGVDIPLARLYEFDYTAVFIQHTLELEAIEYKTHAVVYDDPDSALAFVRQTATVELTEQPFTQAYYGDAVTINLSTVEYAWKKALPPMVYGSTAYIAFEPDEATRFCKGYIVPNGNAVTFEFTSVEDYSCDKFFANSGESATAEIEVNHQLELIIDNGAQVHTYLYINPFYEFDIWGRHGPGLRVHIYDEAKFEPVATHGSYAHFEMYDDPWIGSHGHNAVVDDLIVPGPSIKWVTEEGCVPNTYIPLTEDGDPDYDAMKPDEYGVMPYPPEAIEYKPYLGRLLATCITFVEANDDD